MTHHYTADSELHLICADDCTVAILNETLTGHTDPNFTTLLWTCVYLLCAVCAMSAWWFVLFCKLLLKLATKTAEEVTAEEYTVDTEDEDDADAAAAASTSEADKVK